MTSDKMSDPYDTTDLPQIAHATTISDRSAVNLHVDGSLTMEGLRGRPLRNVLFRLTAAEVRELLRFFAELPALPRGEE